MLRIAEARRWGREELSKLCAAPEPNHVSRDLSERHADELLCCASGLSLAQMIARGEDQLSDEQWKQYRSYIERRLRHEPLQYITGSCGFRELELRVGPGVLIPRPETELLVERAVRCFSGAEPNFKVVDVGTGSGAIILGIIDELQRSYGAEFCCRGEFIGIDLKAEAIRYAKLNSSSAALAVQPVFIEGDLLAAIGSSDDERRSLIVSNPPYIADDAELPESVSEFEPHAALFAGVAGMDVIERLIAEARSWLDAGALLLIEIGDAQRSAVESAAGRAGALECRFFQDLRGVDRIALIKACASNTLLREAVG